ncbi:hypothetical protein AtNW77_Chr2g0230451 [Arabidopsis thaliana]
MNIWLTESKIDYDKDLSWSKFLVVDFEIGPIERKVRIYFAKEGIQVHQKIAHNPKGYCRFLVNYVLSLVQIQ